LIYTDAERRAHARTWTNRQSGYSAVRKETSDILIVAEVLRATAAADVSRLLEAVAHNLAELWSARPKTARPTSTSPRIEF
jgi:DNA/RNA-binding domain of Phe-tRNA-synthetase-like protein